MPKVIRFTISWKPNMLFYPRKTCNMSNCPASSFRCTLMGYNIHEILVLAFTAASILNFIITTKRAYGDPSCVFGWLRAAASGTVIWLVISHVSLVCKILSSHRILTTYRNLLMIDQEIDDFVELLVLEVG